MAECELNIESCPFCGSESVTLPGKMFAWVNCEECESQGPIGDLDGSKWNAVARIVREYKEQNAQQAGGVGG